VILVGVRRFFIALRRKVLAAVRSRLRLRKKSTVRPALSTARYRKTQLPLTFIYVSSILLDPPIGRSYRLQGFSNSGR
jgi:hypothetical protein